MSTDFPAKFHDLQSLMARMSRELPGTTSSFIRLHKEGTATGALSQKIKELMALAIAVAVRCEDCIAYHVHDALKEGATRAEVLEAIGVAIMMGGGPAAMYACEAFQALEQFEKAGQAK